MEAWEIALANTKGPTLLAFSRQDVPTLRTEHVTQNMTAKGAYEIAGADNAQVTFIATGSEVSLAMEARELLKKDNIAARVVSLPCWSLFDEQPAAYRSQILGPGTVQVGIEAGVRQGWGRFTGVHGRFVGMHGFGASGPYKDVYKHFHITPQAAGPQVIENRFAATICSGIAKVRSGR